MKSQIATISSVICVLVEEAPHAAAPAEDARWRYVRLIETPPSTRSAEPVVKLEASDAR